MADVFDVEKRRQIMKAVQNRNTTPEKTVRRIIRSLGFGFRQNVRNIPGKPDFVFSRRRKIIFVHGCFWHRHSCRKGRSLPSTNRDFWEPKLTANKKRDSMVRLRLRRLGWKVLVVWECQTAKRNLAPLKKRIAAFLQPNDRNEL
jgi:DNA mismatch endonuclease, patch repair protein